MGWNCPAAWTAAAVVPAGDVGVALVLVDIDRAVLVFAVAVAWEVEVAAFW